MKMILRSEFPNGQFGDPALYVWELNGKRALLFDCGDLSLFSTRQLLKVSHIFLSHCHVDHFFGFDLFLRVHIGSEKTTTIVGPPRTSQRVGGKLQGYTWNLIGDQNLEFVAVDLDARRSRKTITRFHARNRFRPAGRTTESWDPAHPVLDTGTYQVRAAMIDHRTPSMAYAAEEKLAVGVDAAAIKRLGLKPGPWINELKSLYLLGGLESARISTLTPEGGRKSFRASALSRKVLIPRQRHKIAYVTDGAASPRNHRALAELLRGADLAYCETCFLNADARLARETKHFTAKFIGQLAREAAVKKLVPFHFSKRYLNRPGQVLKEAAAQFQGEVVRLARSSPALGR